MVVRYLRQYSQALWAMHYAQMVLRQMQNQQKKQQDALFA